MNGRRTSLLAPLLAEVLAEGGGSGSGGTRRSYPKGVKFTEQDFAAINIHPASFHGDWYHVIAPTPSN